jgi:hypothetical protein
MPEKAQVVSKSFCLTAVSAEGLRALTAARLRTCLYHCLPAVYIRSTTISLILPGLGGTQSFAPVDQQLAPKEL